MSSVAKQLPVHHHVYVVLLAVIDECLVAISLDHSP